LAQSIGGLGNNNLVTILERGDRNRIVKEGWSPEFHPEIKAPKKATTSPPSEGVGILETFTTLYVTPEGFRSPLTLGFVKTEHGEIVMACNPDYRSPKELKIGKKVYFKTREGLYVFKKLTLWNRLKHWMKGK
jgi:acetyl-CoA C-acetyltransferase